MGLKILSDSLARVLDISNETKCVAISWNVSKNDKTNTLILEGMKFSPKIGNREVLEYQERIFNLIEYCFSNINYNDNFICINKKIKILS